MPNEVAHFSVNADDVERARRFYGDVFGWTFESWGPPGFFLIHSKGQAGPGVQGALQQRREIVKGKRMVGFECTIAVDDIDRALAAVESNGGTVVMPKSTIPGSAPFSSSRTQKGTSPGAMQYDAKAE